MKSKELMKDLDEIRVDANRAIIEIVKKYGKENAYNKVWTLSLNWLTFKVIGVSVDDEDMGKKAYCISDITYHPLRDGRNDEITFLYGNGNGLDAGTLDLRDLISALARLEIITENLNKFDIFNI